ncbi:TetR/AcrR family transcriptional regulator [Rhodococcus sp. H36-A4]|uniref:TetR/AcrR family transcriptional regulator n=1 Tax=Rhodococcus sp. H36-A4 TaxID=3004353 RepID=UPI0022AEF316|nr:TetR/AcrR family transcriptional regulator [Rhodococcus sp. H36-A4]MCZ4076967.1 TetR/AcrR family transcriptional regulator [Rhodococcus sp. H36-A4]
MPTNATANAEQRKQQVLHTATKLFAENGLAGTSMRMIASSIGILPSSLYQYVPSKESLLEEIVIGHLRAMNTEFHRVVDRSLPPELELGELIRRSLTLIDEDPHSPQICRNEESTIRQLGGHDEIRALAVSNHKLWIASLERGISEGVYRRSIAPNVAYELIKDGLWLTGRWFRPTAEYSLADLSVECVEFYLNALMPKQSPIGSTAGNP